MKTIKLILSGVVMMLLGMNVLAQQEPQFTQYMDNMLYYNPAYAGSREMMNISAMHRQQWAGFKGAPITTTFGLHTPLRYDNIGVGLSVVNDKVGPVNATWVNADFSYSLRFKKHKGRLSFGLQAGFNDLNGDLASLIKEDQTDQSVNVRYQNEFHLNIGGGIYYHSKQWFIGFSVPQIVENIKNPGDLLNTEYASRRHYYLTAGGYIKTGRMLKLRPSAMFKFTDNAPFALDMSLAFIFYDKLWLGGNYRLQESGGAFVQYQISNQFKIGYAFEMSVTKLRAYNAGTHEILLSYDLLFKNKSITSPRYF
jgi:type IX secretion system PorP/SprF family membrane protein